MPRTKALSTSKREALNIKGLQAPVEVRRHPAARRMTLRVSRTRRAVIVTLPMQCNLDEAGTFLSSHLDWVRRHLGSVPQPVPFEDGAVVPFRGVPHVLRFTGVRGGGFVVKSATGSIEAETGKRSRELIVAGMREAAARRLHDWLLQQAQRDIDACVQVHATRLKVRPKRIVLRDQSSRWGSCSTTRVLSFSWRLILAPPIVLDYVAAHEVAHLAEMNHGPRFWALVRKTMPDMDAGRSWLRTFGMDLHRYGQDDA